MKALDQLKKDNTDLLGQRWVLAPGGRDTIDKCQNHLWDLQHELSSYGVIFRNLGNNCSLDGDDLYGIGISLERISRRIAKLSDRLSKVTVATQDFAETAS